tara:strand:+ start:28 stop:369 length:342 start_codon:yes stop_codon:yes gene_type:complete
VYKKKQFLKLEKKYSSYQEKGSVGTMMELCHRKLENNDYFKQFTKNSKILEIGAGSSPHVKYVKHQFSKYYFLENSKFAINFLKKNLTNKKNFSLRYIMEKKFHLKITILIEL